MQEPTGLSAFRLFALLLVLLVTAPASCARKVTRTLISPADIATFDGRSPFLKAHAADGRVWVLSDWQVEPGGNAITGTGSVLDSNRNAIRSGTIRLPTDSVVLFESNVVQHSGASEALTLMVGITAAMTVACLANPKACFGSCPTIYAPGPDGRPLLQAESFSSSIAPALEATDVDMLLRTRPAGRDYSLRVTNEALETHVIRSLHVLALPKPAGGRVFHTGNSFVAAGPAVAPATCTAAEGDCLAAVIAADGNERTSRTDSTDLAAREIIELRFDEVPPGDLGLVVVSRQTLVTTFLIYQGLAWMGRDAGRWLASIEPGGGPLRDRASAIGHVLGAIEVLVPDPEGGWRPAGSAGETGPIAADTRLVQLPPGSAGPLRIRLQLTHGLWRLDQVALVPIGGTVEPVRIGPASVTRDGEPDGAALAALLDAERTLVTLPGDAVDVAYRLPPDPDSQELFVEATGYYLEWMREEWLTEENPLLAAQLLLDPGAALRRLAPRFKQQEARMEELFWSSRYVPPNR